MIRNYIWPVIVLSMLTTSDALQQGRLSSLDFQPFSAIETTLKPDSNTTKVQQLPTKVMISTGRKATEVIDLEDSNVMCEDLEDFPISIDNAVGGNLASTPIICGGYFYNGSDHSSDKCFKYTEGGWQHFATMIERRAWAAGIVYNNALHIFGGRDYDTSANLKKKQSSEIVHADGSTTEGPQLPTPMLAHAIASINSTVSIITGGTDATSISNKTWYFNHESQEFQPGPNLLKGRYGHSSGTVTDQETKEKNTIIAGGRSSSPLNSTEMLVNGEWMTGKTQNHIFVHFCIPLGILKALINFSSFLTLGPALPKALYLSSMVELGDNLYIIGGWSNYGSDQNEIHQLSCISGSCSWRTLTQQLKVDRISLVAIPVDNSFCDSSPSINTLSITNLIGKLINYCVLNCVIRLFSSNLTVF